MAKVRAFRVATLAAIFAVAGCSFAIADPPPWAHGGHGHHRGREGAFAGEPAPSHGVLSGTIVGVDYGSASILVGTPRGVVPVSVTPTTSIFRGSRFASLSDLGRGARVEVDFTQGPDGRLIAQIIRIR
jgi:hypothetical protein